MKAAPILIERRRYGLASFAEVSIWRLPSPQLGCGHSFKYRLALVANGRCVLRYDNERGKGDHKHVDGRESPYPFRDLPTLLADFDHDIQVWRLAHEHVDHRS